MATVTFKQGKQVKKVDAKAGDTLLQIGLDAGLPIEHACGGNGFCTTCLCKVTEGMEHLEERNEREENMGVLEDPDRLSCQAKVKDDGDITVEIDE